MASDEPLIHLYTFNLNLITSVKHSLLSVTVNFLQKLSAVNFLNFALLTSTFMFQLYIIYSVGIFRWQIISNPHLEKLKTFIQIGGRMLPLWFRFWFYGFYSSTSPFHKPLWFYSPDIHFFLSTPFPEVELCKFSPPHRFGS